MSTRTAHENQTLTLTREELNAFAKVTADPDWRETWSLIGVDLGTGRIAATDGHRLLARIPETADLSEPARWHYIPTETARALLKLARVRSTITLEWLSDTRIEATITPRRGAATVTELEIPERVADRNQRGQAFPILTPLRDALALPTNSEATELSATYVGEITTLIGKIGATGLRLRTVGELQPTIAAAYHEGADFVALVMPRRGDRPSRFATQTKPLHSVAAA